MNSNDENMSTDVDKPARTIVIVSKKSGIGSLVVKSVAGVVGFIIFLFLAGMVMGFLGLRPPHFEWGVVSSKWNSTVGNERIIVDELEKVNNETGKKN